MDFAIIVAGGSGQRMNSSIPKQFLLLDHKPILCHTIEAFLMAIPDIQIKVVIPEAHWSLANSIIAQIEHSNQIELVLGGNSRFQSVKNGLSSLGQNSDGIVFIHDAVRPFVNKNLILLCKSEALKHGNAIPCIDLKDSIRRIQQDSNHHADRSQFKIIQTPQTFQLNLIQKAFEVEFHEKFTDDASVLEHAGHQIHLVNGLTENFKITEAIDLIFAEAFLQRI